MIFPACFPIGRFALTRYFCFVLGFWSVWTTDPVEASSLPEARPAYSASYDPAYQPPPPKPKIAVVIDDLGDNFSIASQLTELPGRFTLAILPQTPFAAEIASQGHNLRHEIIMHLPMEAHSRPELLGPGALFAVMNQEQLLAMLKKNSQSIPHLVGFNNHMGSLLTEDREKMTWLMAAAKQNQWYFLDSKTSEKSVAGKAASKLDVPSFSRDVFLDHHQPSDDLSRVIAARMEQAKRIARKSGQVVVICHPYRETYEFLKQALPGLNRDFELVPLSRLPRKNS